MGLTDNWQIVENLTDYWHLPWVLLSTDKGPDCPLFSTKPVFKALTADVSKYRPEVYKTEKSKILKNIHKVALGKQLT